MCHGNTAKASSLVLELHTRDAKGSNLEGEGGCEGQREGVGEFTR